MVHNRPELGHVKEAGIDRVDRHLDTVPHTKRALGPTLLGGTQTCTHKSVLLNATTVLEIATALGIHNWATTVEALALQDLACHAVSVVQKLSHDLVRDRGSRVDVLDPLYSILSTWWLVRIGGPWS